MFRTVGFIGTGTMGSVLARAVYKGKESGVRLLLANRTQSKALALAEELPGTEVVSNEEIARTCGLIFLGVKPKGVAELLTSLEPALYARKDRFVICSMAAGITLNAIHGFLESDCPLIRILPNTPAAVGAGIAQFCAEGVTKEEKAEFCRLLAPSGLLDEMPEEMMAVANCVSGCGPAFCAMFIEALADGAVACGLPRDKALVCAAQTLVGTGSLYLAGGVHPGAIKDAVCSPGGVTVQGVRALEGRGFRSTAIEAVIACAERVRVMEKES